MSSTLTPTQKYAAGALFGLALHQAQIHQTHPLGTPSNDDDDITGDRSSSASSSSDSVSDDPQLWAHQSSHLLRPVFRFLEIDSGAWPGLEETAGSTSANHHVGAFSRLLSEEGDNAYSEVADKELALSKAVEFILCISRTRIYTTLLLSEEGDNASSEVADKELALSKAVDAMESSIETTSDFESKKEKHREYVHDRREKFSINEIQAKAEVAGEQNEEAACKLANEYIEKDSKSPSIKPEPTESSIKLDEKPFEELMMLGYQRKVAVLHELLSACLADISEDKKKSKRRRKGYDARHRVALRLLAVWFNVKWIKMEAIEIIVACSAMAILKEEEAKEEENGTPKSSWAKWKRGGIIGAAAITGGTLMAITGGLAAPAIAAGFGALAPTLGTIIPVIGASGFAAVATAAGSVAGSVAVAASFGAAGAGLTGTKMARRTGSVDEFEFKAIGENHNQGRLAVEISISGFVFEEDDFIKPWEGQDDNLERYILQWESKNLIAVSTAIQDWLTSRLAMELMTRGAMLTVLGSLFAALAWPATLLSATDLIDSKWTIAVDRSDKAGKLLADVLLKGLQGHRPVTLVGFSLGARVIFKCLQVLAETEQNAGLVERVVLLGAPIPIKDENWESVRKVVAGRFVNAYSTNDWMLGIAFRASLLTQGLAGIQPIDIPGIENVDVTEFIDGHSSYLWATQQILDRLELDTYFPVFTSTRTKP